MITIITIGALVVALSLTAAAVGTGRHWLVAPAALLVAVTIVGAVALPENSPGPWASLATAIGFGALGVLGGSPVVALVLRFAQGGVELGDHGGIIVAADETFQPRPEPREILRGGATIGYLERIAVLGSAAAGQLAAVAVVVAIKGLGRFSELDDSRARERFIIGTLTSLIWAGACATAAVLLA